MILDPKCCKCGGDAQLNYGLKTPHQTPIHAMPPGASGFFEDPKPQDFIKCTCVRCGYVWESETLEVLEARRLDLILQESAAETNIKQEI